MCHYNDVCAVFPIKATRNCFKSFYCLIQSIWTNTSFYVLYKRTERHRKPYNNFKITISPSQNRSSIWLLLLLPTTWNNSLTMPSWDLEDWKNIYFCKFLSVQIVNWNWKSKYRSHRDHFLLSITRFNNVATHSFYFKTHTHITCILDYIQLKRNAIFSFVLELLFYFILIDFGCSFKFYNFYNFSWIFAFFILQVSSQNTG